MSIIINNLFHLYFEGNPPVYIDTQIKVRKDHNRITEAVNYIARSFIYPRIQELRLS